MKIWFAVARDWDDPDTVDFEWVTSPEEAAQMSTSRRCISPPWTRLVLQLGHPHGHRLDGVQTTPPPTQFDKPPLEKSTISEVTQSQITIRNQWWVDDSLSVTSA